MKGVRLQHWPLRRMDYLTYLLTSSYRWSSWSQKPCFSAFWRFPERNTQWERKPCISLEKVCLNIFLHDSTDAFTLWCNKDISWLTISLIIISVQHVLSSSGVFSTSSFFSRFHDDIRRRMFEEDQERMKTQKNSNLFKILFSSMSFVFSSFLFIALHCLFQSVLCFSCSGTRGTIKTSK